MQELSNTAALIKKYRKEQNMSQEELSEKSGINISSLKKYEIGYRNPKPEQLIKLANALGISANAFFDFKLNTIGDIISLIMKLDKQTEINWSAEKNSNGSYIPNTISISFNDERINNALCVYMNYKIDSIDSSTSDSESTLDEFIDYKIPEYEILLEEMKNRNIMINEPIQKI